MSTNNSLLHTSPKNSISAKMRRLKIQEALLIQNIKKSMPNGDSDSENNFIKADLEFKKYVSELKKSYAEIKHLFNDVKCVTKSQDILKTLDIDEIKKDIVDLDKKIKVLKILLQKEINELKIAEKDIVNQLNDKAMQNNKLKKCSKVATKSYSDIVPSPVKNLINSPLKSPEVQQFQDFVNSSRKFGGWNEYNHNVFVRIWQKHFSNDENHVETDCVVREAFICDVFEKISGVTRNDIFAHISWYSKYLYLKKRQKIALDEWRAKTKPKREWHLNDEQTSRQKSIKSCNLLERKRQIFKHDSQVKREYFSDDSLIYASTKEDNQLFKCIDANEFLKEIDHSHKINADILGKRVSSDFGFTKPTKQWENRRKHKNDFQSFNRNLEEIRKLGIPSWRQVMVREE